MAKKELFAGFTCPRCGEFNKYPSYVYAHWDTPLTFTCECGTVYEIIEGIAEEV